MYQKNYILKMWKIVFIFSIILTYIVMIFSLETEKIAKSDYRSFATGAKILADGKGDKLYNLETQREYQKQLIKPYSDFNFLLPYIYLPPYAMILTPLNKYSFILGYKILSFASLLFVLILLYLTKKIFPEVTKHLTFSLLFLIFIPIFHSILLPQIMPLIAILILLIYKSLKKKKYFLAGILTGFIMLKTQFILIMPFFLMLSKSKKRFVIGFSIVFGLILFISLLLTKGSILTDYPKLLVITDNPEFGNKWWHKYSLYSLMATLIPYLRTHKMVILTINFILYFIVIITYFFKKTKLNFDLKFALAIIFTIIFSIHVFTHDYGIILAAILPILTLSYFSKDKKVKSKYNLISTVLYLIPFTFLLFMNTTLASLVLLPIAYYLFSSNISNNIQNYNK